MRLSLSQPNGRLAMHHHEFLEITASAAMHKPAALRWARTGVRAEAADAGGRVQKGGAAKFEAGGSLHADFSAGRSGLPSAKLAGRHHARLRFAGRERPLASHADIRVFYPTPADGTGAAFEPGWELRS